jgi:hypothetical protein
VLPRAVLRKTRFGVEAGQRLARHVGLEPGADLLAEGLLPPGVFQFHRSTPQQNVSRNGDRNAKKEKVFPLRPLRLCAK